MARGGYRKPSGGSKASGVGKQSRRTDTQPVQVPNVNDSTDLTYGDRQKLEAAQRQAPIGRQREPNIPSAPPGVTGSMRPRQLSDALVNLPSTRQDEPLTQGMDIGPGAGSEVLAPPPPQNDKELVLQWLVDMFQDESANQMLQQMRQPAPEPQPMPAPPQPQPVDSQEPPQPEISGDFPLPEAEPDATDVEEPMEQEAGAPSPM